MSKLVRSNPVNRVFNLKGRQVVWKKVKELKEGMKVAVTEDNNSSPVWDEIVSIKKVGREQVYDIEVEGTHNFVGNDIIAHNTYISGRTGIGTTAPNYAIDVQSSDTSSAGKVNSAQGYLTDGADYAEYFYTNDTNLRAGEVVCVDLESDNAVKRSDRVADPNVMGIVSSNAAIVGNSTWEKEHDKNYVVVGMLGQVAAMVSSENGEIRVGDSLTSAGEPGYAMRANAGDSTVGVALEGLDADEETGVIQVLISRRNKSLTVEQVEEEVTARIAAMEIEDEVDLLMAQAMEAFNEVSDGYARAADLVELEELVSDLYDLIDTSESTESSESGGLSGLAGMAEMFEQMQALFNEFTEFASALGFTLKEDGSLLVNADVLVGNEAVFAGLTLTDELDMGILKVGMDSLETALDQTLYMQPDSTGDIDIFDGKIMLAADGTLTTETLVADAAVLGSLTAKAGSELVGTGTMPAGEKEIEISSTEAVGTYRVYMTVLDDTSGGALYIKEKREDSFVVGMSTAPDEDLRFDWLVVGEEN